MMIINILLLLSAIIELFGVGFFIWILLVIIKENSFERGL